MPARLVLVRSTARHCCGLQPWFDSHWGAMRILLAPRFPWLSFKLIWPESRSYARFTTISTLSLRSSISSKLIIRRTTLRKQGRSNCVTKTTFGCTLNRSHVDQDCKILDRSIIRCVKDAFSSPMTLRMLSAGNRVGVVQFNWSGKQVQPTAVFGK